MPRQATSGKRLSVWTSLPASPLDGQEILYRFAQTVVPTDAQVLTWRLRYDAAVGAWLPVGVQEPVYAQDITQRSQSFGAGWSQFTGAQLIAYAPLAGIYRLKWGAGFSYNNVGVNMNVGLYDTASASWGGPGNLSCYPYGGAATYSSGGGSAKRPGVVPAGTNWTWGLFPSSGAQCTMASRYIEVYPVQIS